MDKETVEKDFAEFKENLKNAKGVDKAKGALNTLTGKAICALLLVIIAILIFKPSGGKSSSKKSSKSSSSKVAKDSKTIDMGTTSEDDFIYALNESGGGLVVTLPYYGDFKHFSKIVIPETHEGLPVTEVGTLDSDREITHTLVLPKTIKKVESISGMAIKSFTMKKGVEYVNGNVFLLENLEDLTIEEGVEIIPWHMFSHCGKLKKVTIPASVKIIENEAFAFCTELKEVNFLSDKTEIDKGAFGVYINSCPKLSIKSQQEIKKRMVDYFSR